MVEAHTQGQKILPQKVSARNGYLWIYSAFAQFTNFPFRWLGIALFNLVVRVLLPFLGPLLDASLLNSASTGANRTPPGVKQFFAGYKGYVARLLYAGLVCWFVKIIYIGVSILSFLNLNPGMEQVGTGSAVGNISSLMMSMYATEPVTSMFSIFGSSLLIISIILLIFYLYSTYELIAGLIIFNRTGALSACQISLKAFYYNWCAVLVYLFTWGVLIGVILIASVLITPFFGWTLLIVYPIYIISLFYMWKDMFSMSTSVSIQ